MNVLRGLAFVAGIFLSSAAIAQTPVTYSQGGTPLFTVDVPDFWAVRTGGLREITDEALGEPRLVNRVIGIRPENDEGAWMGFISPPTVSTLDGGRAYLREISQFLVSDPTVDETWPWRVDGRSAEVIQGTGQRDGQGVNFTVVLIDLPRDRIAVAIGSIAGAEGAAFRDEIHDVFNSFRAAR